MTSNLCLSKVIDSELRALPGNNICSDCDDKNPQWASVSFGIFVCLECSGRHRSLGVHISFVRSVTMDSWNDKQISLMRAGGNSKCIDFLGKYGIYKNTDIVRKYKSKAALSYKEQLEAIVEGRQNDFIVKQIVEDSEEESKKMQSSEAMKHIYGSNGRMSGIGSESYSGMGSESSYSHSRYNNTDQTNNVNIEEIKERVVAVTKDVGQKALSFISTFISTENNNNSNSNNNNINSNNSNSYNSNTGGEEVNNVNLAKVQEHLSQGWSSAVNIWTQGLQMATEKFKVMVEADNVSPGNSNNSSGDDDKKQSVPLATSTATAIGGGNKRNEIRVDSSVSSFRESTEHPVSRSSSGGGVSLSSESSTWEVFTHRDGAADRPTQSADRPPVSRRQAEKKEAVSGGGAKDDKDFFANFGL